MANQKTNKTTKQVKEVKEVKNKKNKKNRVICNEIAYEGKTKKGAEVIILIDYQGNYHYIEKDKQTQYHRYTGEPYESNNHLAYTFIEDTFEDTKDTEDVL